MEVGAWIRLMGLCLTWALSSDVYQTVQAIKIVSMRRRVKIILGILPLLNVFSFFMEAFSTHVCPIMINLLAVSYYLCKILVSYLYCMRVDVLLRGPMRSQRMTNILFLIKLYLCISFALNIGKALTVYKSFMVEDGICAVDFGEGLWVVLDEIMFTISDVITISMLAHIFFSYVRSSSIAATATKDETRMAFLRLLRISIIPLISTLSTTVQVIVDHSTGFYMGSIDMQVHILCVMIAHATRPGSRGNKPALNANHTNVYASGPAPPSSFHASAAPAKVAAVVAAE